jgi:predicted Zn-dependent peptidase
MKARIYTLKNGLTVYLTVNKNEPRVQTVIAVRAGSKHDPQDATGLAHYLEHMLFKGTAGFGSLDFSKEGPLVSEIEQRFENYRRTTDPEARKRMYHEIDSVSGVAAKYAIANEYDKMVGALGAKGTNASTWFDYTRYINDIPANQIETWLAIESERFRAPVLRLFHTELEAVYEEKNISLDNDQNAQFDLALAELFKKHTYGTQTTLGTVEHLKNPSMTRIMEYYKRNYVPNNMCVALSGDFDPDKVIQQVDAAFSYMQPSKVTQPVFPPEDAITAPVKKELYGPDPENILLAYRFPGITTREATLMRLVDMILSNQTAGLIDLDLNQQQKVLSAGSFQFPQVDYSVHFLFGNPLTGQKLEDVEKLLLAELEKVKRGEFDDNLITAIANDLTVRQMREYESNYARANNLADAYINFQNWADYVQYIDEVATITKKEVMDFAKKYYNNNYIAVYKLQGKRETPKVDKPAITPVEVNRTAESPFLKNIIARTTTSTLEPRFVDYEKDIQKVQLTSEVPIYYLKNDENKLFTLYYLLDMGKRHDKKLAYALGYLDLLGTNNMSAADVKKKLYALGLTFGVSSSEDQVYVYLSGLDKSFSEGVKLFEDLLKNCKPDDEALAGYVGRTLKSREDAKKDKNVILNQALYEYGRYGKRNPFVNQLTTEELQSLKASDLTDKIHSLTSYAHRALYYGPHSVNEVKTVLANYHKLPATLKPVPTVAEYEPVSTSENRVLFCHYPDMTQSEIIFLSKSYNYDAARVPVQTLYNEYFGGGMSSIVFQTIRESKALAYSCWSNFIKPQKKNDPNYMYAYIGTQADKLPEAMHGMYDLLVNMPEADPIFAQAKDAIKKKIASERITRTNILMNYESARKLGLDHDIRRDVYNSIDNMNFKTIADFQKEYIKGARYNILVLGSKDKVDTNKLKEWGSVTEVSLEEIFGY